MEGTSIEELMLEYGNVKRKEWTCAYNLNLSTGREKQAQEKIEEQREKVYNIWDLPQREFEEFMATSDHHLAFDRFAMESDRPPMSQEEQERATEASLKLVEAKIKSAVVFKKLIDFHKES